MRDEQECEEEEGCLAGVVTTHDSSANNNETSVHTKLVDITARNLKFSIQILSGKCAEMSDKFCDLLSIILYYLCLWCITHLVHGVWCITHFF